MSGSWNQSERKLIRDLRETLRLYFKGARCFPIDDLTFRVRPIFYHLPLLAETYGGVLVQQKLSCQTVPPVSIPAATSLDTAMISCIQQEPLPIAVAPSCPVLPISQETTTAETVALLPRNIYSGTLSVAPPEPLEGILGGAVEPIACEKPFHIPPHQLKFHRHSLRKTKRLLIQRPEKPKIGRIAKIRATIQQMPLRRNSLPIYRKPIPFHRFSLAVRNRFRELLASKANVPPMDVKLVAIYDRMFLGIYQSLSRAEDETLLCLPKSSTELAGQQEQTAVSFYLAIGKSNQAPDKYWQAVIPMSELNHEQ